jgi:DNA polymerase-3 subunit alpha
MNFAPLWIESNFQMNGSNIRLNDLVEQAVSFGYSFLALTDDRLYGTYKFYTACKKRGITPILGMQITIEGIQEGSSNRFLLYAKNNTGYKHLLYLASIHAHRLVTLADIKRRQEGLIAVLITDQSELLTAIRNQQEPVIREVLDMLTTHFEQYYVALSNDDQVNQIIRHNVDIIAVPRVSYMKPEDKDVFDVLRQIFNQESSDVLGQESIQHLLSKEETLEQYKNYPDALANTIALAKQCDVTIASGDALLPSYPVPGKVPSKDYLHALAYKGLEKRIQGTKKDYKTYQKRLQYELDIIDSMGYNDYFLIVWDFVKYAKQQGYLVGPGRGSAAASLVSYCLGITSVDSVEFDLVFERFLNPERITLPDIDMDLPDDKRDDIIKYVKERYGHNRVSSICTFGTFLMKSAIRDTARIAGVEGVLLDQMIKETSSYDSIPQMIDESSTIQNIMRQHPQAYKTLQIAGKIEGLHRHVSTHAAGIILTEDDMMHYTAVQPGLLDMFQTQFEAKDLETLGLLKIDFLGLRNLTSINRITDLIKEQENTDIDVYQIPLDDEPTFALLRKVETTGLFQLESPGMRRLIADMQIREFNDIVTCLALFRPGPMDNIPAYLDRRFGREKVSYQHPILEDVLSSTSGIIIYQEQIIQIASLFAGYSLGEADLLRRAVSKKQESVLEQERANFIRKATEQGRELHVAEEIYDYIVKFANYGFNKAHSVAYAMVSYWMAYLKANYPKFFISVLTTSVIGSESSMREYIFEATKLGVTILQPSINESTAIFEPKGQHLRYPLLGIKYVGINAVQAILQERQNGLFRSFVDTVKRLHKEINKRVMESLIQAGAFDEFSHSKKAMLEQLENIIQFTQLGEFIGDNEFVFHEMEEYSYPELEALEQRVLGFNLFVNPLQQHQEYIDKHGLLLVSDINQSHLQQELRLVAVVQRIRQITTKNNKPMAFVTLSDAFLQMTGVFFTRTYATYKDILTPGNVYLLKGKIEERKNELQIIVSNVHPLS